MTTETEATSSGASSAATSNPQITVVNRHLNIKPFIVSSDNNDTAVRWDKWKKEIERQFRFFGLTDAQTKKDGLIIYGGSHIADLEDSLPEVPAPAGEDEYARLIKKLDKNFLPRKNKDYARFQFGNLTQSRDESMAAYYTRIREIARKCEFTDENEMIRDHLIKTMTSGQLRIKTIRNNLTLAQILDEAAIDEESSAQAAAIERRLKEESEAKMVKQITKKQTREPLKECDRCGTRHAARNCRAYGAECHKCGKRNHYAKVCRSGEKESRRKENGKREQNHQRAANYKGKGHRQIRHVEQGSDSDRIETESESDEDINRILKHVNIHKTANVPSKSLNKCKVWIHGIETIVEPDTGADTNVMDEEQFKTLQHARPEVRLRKTTIKLKTLTEDLPVIGEFTATIANETRCTTARIPIIRGTMDSLPLLGRETLEELGMVKFDATGGLKKPNRDNKTVHKVQTGNKELDQIIDDHEKLFHGIGKAQRDGRDIEIHLPLKDNAEPVTQKPRRVPYHLVEPLKKRMQEFVDNDIMEPVPEHESITWCSPLVVQPKPKRPDDIRVSLDLRVLNKSMQRTRQVQAPITEDFIATFKDCRLFSKLDMNHGYHQFALDAESRKLMTFASPEGNYRYKRLAFGGLNSQDLFDAEMSRILSGLQRALNNRDDILIGGLDEEDHNKNLAAVLKRLQAHNLTLRREKCEFGKTDIEFHGHLFTSEGLKPSPNKVKAVRECTPPKSREELVSFLQMMAYLSRYITNFSSRCEPLRRLTHNKAKFDWTTEQQDAFEDLKEAITTAPVLVPYKPDRETLVICDGSPTGLGGGLFQKTDQGFQPVHFVSRTLTDTEKRYSQIEREALAAEFTTTRLSIYLLGAPHFQLATDHKPLLPLLNNPKAKLPPRIERIVMKMQNLDYTAIHIAGKSNMTDYISRHAIPDEQHYDKEHYIKAIVETNHAVVMATIQKATREDRELQKLQTALLTGRWDRNDPDIAPYYDLRAEIYTSEDVVLRLDKIIPPESLRDKIITVSHKQGHLGMAKTKELLRRKYWFPGMNRRIEATVSTCFSCQVSTNTPHTEPAKMTELPERPWDTVEADFCGPLPNNEYALVVTDQYSRYPEVEFVTSTACKPTRKKLKKMFATHGIPKVVQTDNGPPFNSAEFTEFSAEAGFHHRKITPRHPKSQGQVEGFNKLINKIATIANHENIDVHEATYDMLQAYRETPHPATKKTPYELMMNREVRTRLEHFPIDRPAQDADVRKHDEKFKAQIKTYHDKRHRATTHKLAVGQAILVKRDQKRKAQTPYEPHIYIITEIKGSTVKARRIGNGQTICRDASRVKQLKSASATQTDPEGNETEGPRAQVPPCYDSNTNQDEPAIQQVECTRQTAQPRRSRRKHISVFDNRLRDFTQK